MKALLGLAASGRPGVAATAVTLAAWFSAPAYCAPIDRAAFLALSQSVGRVEAGLVGGRTGVGSAVTVAPGVLVTNCHVTSRARTISVVGSGVPWPVTGQVADEVHDVCFLRVPQWPHAPVRMQGGPALRVGQTVAAVGYTGGAAATLREGSITALHAHDAAQIIETDTAFTSGASGGALFNEDGVLVGLLTFRMRGALGHYFAVPRQWIVERLPRDSDWVEVAPLPGLRPFWARDPQQLPPFMRAASLQALGRWVELREVAESWTKAEPGSAEAYLALGIALRQLVAPDLAVASLRRAIALAPENANAWFNLGRALRATGDRAGVQRVLAALGELDDARARQLRDEVDALWADTFTGAGP